MVLFQKSYNLNRNSVYKKEGISRDGCPKELLQKVSRRAYTNSKSLCSLVQAP